MRTLLLCILSINMAYAADPALIDNIILCESGGRLNECHKDIDDAKYGPSCGITQFKKPTFYEFAALAIKEGKWDFNSLGKPSWMNPLQQVFLLDWALDHNRGNRWTCYKLIKD